MSWKLTTPLAALVPVLLGAGPLANKAEAHASPHGLQLVWQSTDPNALPVILSNRGLLMPNVNNQDGLDPTGKPSAYSLRCNESYFVNTSAIPFLTLDDQQNLVMSTSNGVSSSSDRGCNWSDGSGYPDPGADVDAGTGAVGGAFFQNQAMPNKMVASNLIYTSTAQLFGSSDYGRTWTVTGMNSQLSTYGQFLATPDGQTVYAQGNYYDMSQNALVYLWSISTDGGSTWTDKTLPANTQRYPLGLHPTKSNVIFAREPNNDPSNPLDVLTRSDDGGQTFTMVTTLQPITSFVTTPDGSHIWVGSSTQGLWDSTDDGLTFKQVDPSEVQGVTCLAYRNSELWVCANFAPNTNGIWKSTDSGASFSEVLNFVDIATEVKCDAGSEPICHQLWLDWQFEVMYNFTVDAGTPGYGDSGTDSDAGLSTNPDAGDLELDDAGRPVFDAGVAPTKPKSGDGGGCSTSPSSSTGGEEVLLSGLLAALAILVARRSKAS